MNGLIRVAVYDQDCKRAYVVAYYEQNNKYTVNAICPLTGDVYWSKDVPNGGYGAPAITNDCIIMPTEFASITALSKQDGTEKWTFRTRSRVRSPINVVADKIYFSSGGTIFELTFDGQVVREWHYPRAFFYGSVDMVNDLIITLGVVADEENKSVIKVFAFHKTNQVAYELPICRESITSTDTCGIGWHQGIGYVGAENIITAFQGNSGKILWTAQVEGFAGRQVCTTDEKHVYYVTQSGVIGALSILDGSHVWTIYTQDSLLVSPVSVVNDKVIIPADAHLLILKASNGQLLQKIPVGHSPYSMLSLNNDFGILGAGEPPHNGIIYGFKLNNENERQKYTCAVQSSNAIIEAPFFDICIQISDVEESIIEARLDGGNFYLQQPILGQKTNNTTYVFRIPTPRTIGPGDYVLLLSLIVESGACITRPVAIRLIRRNALPSRVYLHHIPSIEQEKPMYSGAAIAAALKSMHGDATPSQANMREMVDAVRHTSGYEPFQTWRIILRRVLTSQAQNKQELPEFAPGVHTSTDKKPIKLLK